MIFLSLRPDQEPNSPGAETESQDHQSNPYGEHRAEPRQRPYRLSARGSHVSVFQLHRRPVLAHERSVRCRPDRSARHVRCYRQAGSSFPGRPAVGVGISAIPTRYGLARLAVCATRCDEGDKQANNRQGHRPLHSVSRKVLADGGRSISVRSIRAIGSVSLPFARRPAGRGGVLGDWHRLAPGCW